jgi:hypothetical protein
VISVRAAADPVAAAASALTQITREEKSASDAVQHITAEVTALDKRRAAEDEARLTTLAKHDALKETAAYQDALSATANAQQLAEQATRAEEIADRSDRRAWQARDAVSPAERHLESTKKKLHSAERAVATVSDKVSAHAPTAGLVDVTARYLPDLDTARLRQAATLRAAAAEKATELIGVHAKALSIADTAAEKAREAGKRLSKAQRLAAAREAAVAAAVGEVAEQLSGWARGLYERIRPSAELVEDWCRLVAGLTATEEPVPVLGPAIGRDHLSPVRRPLDQRRAKLDQELAGSIAAMEALQVKLVAVEAERDPSPRDPEFWTRRDRPDGITDTGAPFWRLVETAAGASAAELEAALDATGLLQAWVTPDGAYLASRDGSETVWAASARAVPTRQTLRAVLRPADDAGDLAEVIERLLTSVAYGEELPAVDVAVAADGRWRHGELTGLVTPSRDGPRLLGAAARAADRERRITQLRTQLSDLADTRELLSLELDEITVLLEALNVASEHLPSDARVVSAVVLARDAMKAVDDAQSEVERSEEAEREARTAADTAATEVVGHCGEHGLPRTRAEVDAVIRALSGYHSLLGDLDAALGVIEPLRDAVRQAKETLDGCREAAATAAGDAEHDRGEALALRAKSDAAQAALSQDAQEILVEVGHLRRRIKAADETLKRLSGQHEKLAEQRSRAGTILEQRLSVGTPRQNESPR